MAHLSLFLTALLAATLLPAQSEAVLAAMLLDGTHDWRGLVLVATVGNTLGATINWILGRFASHFRNREWFPLRSRLYERAQDWFARYGVWSLLLSWLPFVGDPLTVIAGVLRVKIWTFLILVTIGKASRYLIITATTLWLA